MRVALLVIAFILTATAAAEARMAGPCFTVHGRLSIYNGSFVHRIWPVNSHRLLALVDATGRYDEEKAPVPASLQHVFDKDPEARIFANFRLCPITRSRPGVMQHVHLIGVVHVVVVPSAR